MVQHQMGQNRWKLLKEQLSWLGGPMMNFGTFETHCYCPFSRGTHQLEYCMAQEHYFCHPTTPTHGIEGWWVGRMIYSSSRVGGPLKYRGWPTTQRFIHLFKEVCVGGGGGLH